MSGRDLYEIEVGTTEIESTILLRFVDECCSYDFQHDEAVLRFYSERADPPSCPSDDSHSHVNTER